MTHATLTLGLVLCFSTLLRGVSAQQARQGDAKTTRIYIAHVNDVHNRITPITATGSKCDETNPANKCYGGYARIGAQVDILRKRAKAEKAGFFFLDAGDEFTGTLWDTQYKGAATVQLQNLIRPDAMVVGNHEFDFGPAVLAEYIKRARFPVLGACNVDASGDPDLRNKLEKYTVLNFQGIKIGVLGWVTPTTAVTSSGGPNVKFSDIAPAATACINELRNKRNVDLVVALSHAGYDVDLQIAQQVAGLDLIIGGHTHTFLYTPPPNVPTPSDYDTPGGPYPTFVNGPSGKSVPIVQAYFASKYMGLLQLDIAEVGSGKGRTISVQIRGAPILLGGPGTSNVVPKDPKVQALIDQLDDQITALEMQVVGETLVRLVQLENGVAVVRKQETNLGNYVTDVLVRSARLLPGFEDVQIAVTNGGGLRAEIDAGPITVAEVVTVLPFGNVLSIFELSGQDIINSLKSPGLASQPGVFGGFLQVSGLRIFHNDKVLLKVQLFGNGVTTPVDINPSARYPVVSNDFTAKGGDGYPLFGAAPKLFPTGAPLDQLVIDDITKNSPIAPTVEGRIINCATANAGGAVMCFSGGPTPGFAVFTIAGVATQVSLAPCCGAAL